MDKPASEATILVFLYQFRHDKVGLALVVPHASRPDCHVRHEVLESLS